MDKTTLRNAYITIGEANGLTYVRPNVFVNDIGIEFYLDKYGFHTITKYNNTTVIAYIEKVRRCSNNIQNLSINNDVIGKKSKTKLRHILSDDNLTTEEQLTAVWEYLDKSYEEAELVANKVSAIEKQYKNKP